MSKAKQQAIAIAEGGRDGEVRYFGEIEATTAAVERFVRKLEKKHPRLHFSYEAGPTGYGLYRQTVETRPPLRYRCALADPETSGRARQDQPARCGLPGAAAAGRRIEGSLGSRRGGHEAVRDMLRVRATASEDLRKKRQQFLSFLLRHGRVFTGPKNWSRAHARWLGAQKFDHPAQQIVFQDQVDVITDAQNRLERLDAQLAELALSWSWRRWWRPTRGFAASPFSSPSPLSAKLSRRCPPKQNLWQKA